MSDVEAAPRRKISEALKNGPGTVISRLITMAMPFMLAASVWIAGYVVLEGGEEFPKGPPESLLLVATDTARLSALTMPVVTVASSPNGEPKATTG